MERIGRGAKRTARWMASGAGVGSLGVALLILAAPLAGANYVSTSWTAIGTASAAGPTFGSGVNTPTAGQPTAVLTGGVVHATFGFSSRSGTGLGQASYQQTAYGWATPSFFAWKTPGSHYNVSVLFGFNLPPNSVVASVNCISGGWANATAVIFMEIGIYDLTTRTWAAALGPPGPPPNAIVAWAPFNATCSPGTTASAGNPGMSLATLGNLTGPIGIVLTTGNSYQVEGLIGAYGLASTTTFGATASAVVNFGSVGFVEIAYSTAY